MIIKEDSFDNVIFKSEVPLAIIFTMQVQGLGIARSLVKEGIPVLAMDQDRNNYGLFSKHVTSLISPNAAKQESPFIDFLVELGKNLKNKGVLFPTHDPELLALSKHRKILEKYYYYPMAEHEVIERCVDKFKLYPIADRIGIPIPKTFFPKNLGEAEEISKITEYPCIIKPDVHDNFFELFHRTALLASDQDDLLKNYKEAVENGLRVMIQEIIQGRAGQLYTLGSYADRNSQLKGIFTGKKIRQYPADFGTCRLAEPVSNPELINLGERLIKGLKYHGVSQIEFKKDPKDGKFKLMEINARNWMWISLPTACGVNLPAIAYKDTLGQRIDPPVRQKKVYIKWTYLDNDFKNCCLGGYKRSGHPEESLSVFRWLWSVKGRKVYATFSWKDPKPYITLNMYRVKKALLNLLKKNRRN